MARPLSLSDDEILRRARGVFVERGYAARTKEIAAAVGLTWGALAFRFGEKRELFRRAMLQPAPGADTVEAPPTAGDLRSLLEQARAYLSEDWPRRLHYRLAESTVAPGEPVLSLAGRLAAILQAHAELGRLRRDIPVPELAQLVVSVLVGDVARRFVRCEQAPRSDPQLVDQLLQLIEADAAGGRS